MHNTRLEKNNNKKQNKTKQTKKQQQKTKSKKKKKKKKKKQQQKLFYKLKQNRKSIGTEKKITSCPHSASGSILKYIMDPNSCYRSKSEYV